MDPKTQISLEQWASLFAMAREGKLPVSPNTLKAVRYGRRAWTVRLADAVHELTGGEIPRWVTMPQVFSPGQAPPAQGSASEAA